MKEIKASQPLSESVVKSLKRIGELTADREGLLKNQLRFINIYSRMDSVSPDYFKETGRVTTLTPEEVQLFIRKGLEVVVENLNKRIIEIDLCIESMITPIG